MSGIRTIEDVRERCRIDDITGCWLWSGAKTRGKPIARFRPAGKSKSFGVILHILKTGGRMPKGRVYYAHCGEPSCVNPDHRTLGSLRDAQMVSVGPTTPEFRARCVLAMRRRSKLTLDDVAAIRSSVEPSSVVAKRYGIHFSTVCDIRNGETWAPVSGASAFAWRP